MKNTIILFFIFCTSVSFAQQLSVQGTRKVNDPELSKYFRYVEQYEISWSDLKNSLIFDQKESAIINVQLGKLDAQLQLFPVNLFTEKAVIIRNTAHGPVEFKPNSNIKTFRGIESGFQGGTAALTISERSFSLMFKVNGKAYYLEQYRSSNSNFNPNSFILYSETDVLPGTGFNCMAENANGYQNKLEKSKETEEESEDLSINRNKECRIINISLACDYSYTSRYKGPIGAEDQMVAVLNLVQDDWYAPLDFEYQFAIANIWVSEDSLKDPFRNSASLDEHLNIFTRNFSSMFVNGFDCATLWTVKFGGAGTAFQASMCRQLGLHVCSEGIAIYFILRTLQSHELGHVFSAVHDAPFVLAIMAANAGQTGSNVWSAPSKSAIADYTRTVANCLTSCSAGRVPVPEFQVADTVGCIPYTVQFQNLSSNANMFKWAFPGGTPSTSVLTNPVVTYNTLGTWDVSLEAINPLCSLGTTKIKYIRTEAKPIAEFQGGNTQLPDDRTVVFVNNTQRGATYKWTFGDGEESDEFEPIHEYAKDSTYKVCLTSYNQCGQDEICKNISVYTYPVAAFTTDTNAGCAPTVIKYIDESSSNVIAWNWEFPGGKPSVSNQKNPVVVYEHPGYYRAKLTVNTKKFFTHITKDSIIKIDTAPISKFTYQISADSIVSFSNQSQYAVSHEWDFGDGSPKDFSPNPMHTYKNSGKYEVRYKAINHCGETVSKQPIVLGGKPIANFDVASNIGCAPFKIKFNNSSAPVGASYEWSFPGGNPATSTDQNPEVEYNNSGKYDVRLIVRNGFDYDTLNRTSYIEVKENPVAKFKHSIAGFESFFTNESQNGDSYFWDFGDLNGFSTEANPSYKYKAEGEYFVTLVVGNLCKQDTIVKKVTVYLIPKVAFKADVVKGCIPLSVKFDDLSSDDVIAWNWQFEGGDPMVSFDENPTVTYKKVGLYTVKLSVRNTNGMNSETKVKYIYVRPKMYCNRIPGDKGPGEGGPLQNPDQHNALNGSTPDISISPNPFEDQLSIYSAQSVNYTIYQLSGKPIMTVKNHIGTKSIDLSMMESGIYMIQFQYKDQIFIEKIMKY